MNFEPKEKQNASRSDVQLKAEKWILEEANRKLGFSLIKPGCTYLDENKVVFVELDGIDWENRVICEIYAHIGPLKGGQPGKIAKDILKLHLVEDFLKKNDKRRWRKYIFFADKQAEKNFKSSSSWLAQAVKTLGIKTEIIDLPPELHEEIKSTQIKQSR